jgi:hypothetical protein
MKNFFRSDAVIFKILVTVCYGSHDLHSVFLYNTSVSKRLLMAEKSLDIFTQSLSIMKISFLSGEHEATLGMRQSCSAFVITSIVLNLGF